MITAYKTDDKMGILEKRKLKNAAEGYIKDGDYEMAVVTYLKIGEKNKAIRAVQELMDKNDVHSLERAGELYSIIKQYCVDLGDNTTGVSGRVQLEQVASRLYQKGEYASSALYGLASGNMAHTRSAIKKIEESGNQKLAQNLYEKLESAEKELDEKIKR